jgi:putative DNA primase/helicase
VTAAALRQLADDGGPPVDDRALADLPLTDLGNRSRFLARCGEDFATGDAGLKAWDGIRWVGGTKAKRLSLLAAQSVAEKLRDEFDALEADESWFADEPEKRQARLKAFRTWIKASCSRTGLNAMVECAEPHLVRDDKIWDRHPNRLVTPNQVLEISGGEVARRAHQREDFITHCTDALYDPDADCPAFKAAVAVWFPARDDRAYLQRVLGSCLVDSSGDQRFIVWQGAGRNSKTLLMNVIRRVIGDYHMVMDPATLLARQRDGAAASPDLARLNTRPRLVSAEEPERGKALAEGLIKALTGGMAQLARALYEGLSEFECCFKPFLIVNELPPIKGGDEGIWRRLQRMVWRVTFRDESEPDDGRPLAEDPKAFEAKLIAEASGILNWLIEGCCDWMIEGGLKPPARVLEDTLEWRSVSDTLGRFLSECCERGPDKRVEVNVLYGSYTAWAKQEGQGHVMSKAAFGRALTASKQIQSKKSNGMVYRMEIALRADAPRGDSDDFTGADADRYERVREGEE